MKNVFLAICKGSKITCCQKKMLIFDDNQPNNLEFSTNCAISIKIHVHGDEWLVIKSLVVDN